MVLYDVSLPYPRKHVRLTDHTCDPGEAVYAESPPVLLLTLAGETRSVSHAATAAMISHRGPDSNISTSTMTATRYQVVYPNPLLRKQDRVRLCSIDSQTDRRGLLSQLYEEYSGHTEDLERATLWKASGLSKAEASNDSMQNVYDWLLNKCKCEDPEILRSTVVKSFPDGPHDQSLEQVDVVVVTPAIVEAMRRGVADELRYIKAREELARAIELTLSPSESVRSATAVEEAVSGPDPMTLDRAFDLVVGATDFFHEGGRREAALKPILQGLLVGDSQWQMPTAGGTAKQDGIWFKGPFGYLVVELKNEPGLGGDPFLQGFVAYAKIITQNEYSSYLGHSNMPVILLAIAGNCLVMSTAVFTDAIYANELLSTRLHLGPHSSDNVLHIARVFMAINNSTERLRELYEDLRRVPRSSPPQAKVLRPNPTADPPGLIDLPELEFFCKVDRADGAELPDIDEDNERHAMYLARMQIGTLTRVVFVKFAAKYHEAARRLLADQDPPLAPTLYLCARVIGDMYMVVMEYIPKSRDRSILSHFSTPPPQAVSGVVYRDVCKALYLLHERDFVFGDLREVNLLYLPKDGGRVLLVDFDGVGRDGMDRYSACLNPEAGLGVKRRQIMERHMIARIWGA
ncbi:hypothetical protein BDM02DRAFT_3264279 [Thelephora ganbajun]|uniref:Uncharacterized protein n=1 Tax=Thelephora ganbajun TaxID=370292 RepID=A0ACB6Z093_THEGA|nr:hypothetical protein BDM02DRAFT_3264279 [Thelephora ganbajun]